MASMLSHCSIATVNRNCFKLGMAFHFSCLALLLTAFLNCSSAQDCPDEIFSKLRQNENLIVSISRHQANRPLHETERLLLTIEENEFAILLYRTKNLVSPKFATSYFSAGKQLFIHKVLKSSISVLKNHASIDCNYQGSLEKCENSSVALNLCNDIRGIITVHSRTLALSPVHGKNPEQPKTHVLKMVDEQFTAMKHDVLPYVGKKLRHTKRRKTRSLESQPLFVELLLVCDLSEFMAQGSNVSAVEDRFITMVNVVDCVFKQLGVRVVLYHIEVWNEMDMIKIHGPNGDTLDNFRLYRRQRIEDSTDPENPWKQTDNAQLIINQASTSTLIGSAYIAGMCSSHSVAVVRDFTSHAPDVALTMTHELGHNFGMNHDDIEGCACPNDLGCVMATFHNGQTTWSNCSAKELQIFLRERNHYCVLDVPDAQKIITDPNCGNGILEMGEECDCGTPESCKSKCCNASTCSLFDFAECYEDLCCDDQCQLVAEASECRSSEMNDCDLPEYCTGNSGQCPQDRFVLEGSICSNGTCIGGLCRSRDILCKQFWGKDALDASDFCYSINTFGRPFGNCGRDVFGNNTRCTESNKHCGTLHCTFADTESVNEPIIPGISWVIARVMFGEELCLSLTSGSSDAAFDGLVLDGTGCGDGLVCHNTECTPVLGEATCEDMCHGRGVCNDLGSCHCNVGWDPPFCNTTGVGGSVESGPAAVISPHVITVEYEPEVVDFVGFDVTISTKDQISTNDHVIDPIVAPVGSKFTTDVLMPSEYKSQLTECWGASTEDPGSMRVVDMITDSCPVGETTVNDTGEYVTITTNISRELDHQQNVYVHCTYQVCISDDDELCEPCL